MLTLRENLAFLGLSIGAAGGYWAPPPQPGRGKYNKARRQRAAAKRRKRNG